MAMRVTSTGRRVWDTESEAEVRRAELERDYEITDGIEGLFRPAVVYSISDGGYIVIDQGHAVRP